MDSAARTALPAAGLGLPTTPTNGAPQTLTADAKLRDPIQAHRLPMTTLTEVPVLISLTENAALTATLAPGLGQLMILSSGAQPMLRAGASRAAQTEAQTQPQNLPTTTPTAAPVLISMTENAERTATPAPGLGLPMTPINGAQLTPPVDASRTAQMAGLTITQTMETTHQTQTIQPISIPGAMHAAPTLTMIAH